MTKRGKFTRLEPITKKQIAARAMTFYWREGYYAASINEVVKETGIDQHTLYTEFNGRQGLFIAALYNYIDEIVMAGFTPVENSAGGVEAIEHYFDKQIALAVRMGLPGQGCFITKTILKTSPQNRMVRSVADAALHRLTNGFETSLRHEAGKRNSTSAPTAKLATFLMTSSLGLWMYAGHTRDVQSLKDFRKAVLHILEDKLSKPQ